MKGADNDFYAAEIVRASEEKVGSGGVAFNELARPGRAAEHDNGDRCDFFHHSQPEEEIQPGMAAHVIVQQHQSRVGGLGSGVAGLVGLKEWHGRFNAIGFIECKRGVAKENGLPNEPPFGGPIIDMQERQRGLW